MKKYANGILVDLTSDEIAEANARQKSWDDDSSKRKSYIWPSRISAWI